MARRVLVLATMAVTCAGTLTAVAVPALAKAAVPALVRTAPATSYFSATTTASAIHVSFTQSPADSIITGSLVNDAAGYATSGFDSGGSSEAAAAPLYPGSLVVGGPGLLCTDLFMCPFTPPAYPLLADASYPRDPRAHALSRKPTVALGSVLSVTPSGAAAQAHIDGNSSTTRTGRISLLGGTPLALSIGSSTASTRVETHGRVMTIDVGSALSDIRVGPLLKIGAIRTTDAMSFVPGHHPADHPRVRISGVTVAGQSATITSTGIHLAGHHLASLANKLVRSGIKVHTLGVARTDHANSARSSAGGVEIDFAAPLKNAPYIPNPLANLPGLNEIPGVDLKGTYLGLVQLGGAGAAGALQQQPGGAMPPASTTGRAPKTSRARPTSRSGNNSTTAGAVKAPTATPPPPAVAASPQSGVRLFTVALSRDDLLTLYLVLALGTAGIFLGWRGSVVYRRRPSATGRRR
jgi:hypothetical protein